MRSAAAEEPPVEIQRTSRHAAAGETLRWAAATVWAASPTWKTRWRRNSKVWRSRNRSRTGKNAFVFHTAFIPPPYGAVERVRWFVCVPYWTMQIPFVVQINTHPPKLQNIIIHIVPGCPVKGDFVYFHANSNGIRASVVKCIALCEKHFISLCCRLACYWFASRIQLFSFCNPWGIRQALVLNCLIDIWPINMTRTERCMAV